MPSSQQDGLGAHRSFCLMGFGHGSIMAECSSARKGRSGVASRYEGHSAARARTAPPWTRSTESCWASWPTTPASATPSSAQRLHLSPPAVHERVKRLRRDGVIKATVARLDGPRLGRPLLTFVHVDTAGWGKSAGDAGPGRPARGRGDPRRHRRRLPDPQGPLRRTPRRWRTCWPGSTRSRACAAPAATSCSAATSSAARARSERDHAVRSGSRPRPPHQDRRCGPRRSRW